MRNPEAFAHIGPLLYWPSARSKSKQPARPHCALATRVFGLRLASAARRFMFKSKRKAMRPPLWQMPCVSRLCPYIGLIGPLQLSCAPEPRLTTAINGPFTKSGLVYNSPSRTCVRVRCFLGHVSARLLGAENGLFLAQNGLKIDHGWWWWSVWARFRKSTCSGTIYMSLYKIG